MNAIEFQTTINENGTINIPNEFAENVGANIKVILLTEKLLKKKEKKVTFNAASVDTKNFKFCREYANER